MALMLKCKMCGGDLDLIKDSSLATCQYCGTTQTVPAVDDDKKARLFNRANQYRMDSEFDKAYAAYENIVNDQPDEAEAYWGMLLSEYGVEYVDDPKTGKKVPTCHRTLVRSVTANPNYKAACQHADAESRIMYEDDAAVLDALQKRVLNASAKEEPYDVFICYKESDENGDRTADSVMAQDIYDALTAKGMRVFFSRISLEDKLGQDYEPCIFAALNSAKVMLMVTADSDHCNSVWVKNEWKRYLDFMKNDPTKTLIPVYKDISPYTLPDEFSRFQAQDMGKLGAIQDLVRGVEKLSGKAKKTVGGMTQEEKTMVNAMRRSQHNSRFLILFFAFFLASFFATGFTLAEYDRGAHMQWVIMTTPRDVIDVYWLWWDNELVIPAMGAIPLMGMVSWLSHGLRSRFSKWYLTILYMIVAAVMITFQLKACTMGVIMWAIFAYFGLLASITTLVAHKGDPKRIKAHFLLMAITLVLTVVTGFI